MSAEVASVPPPGMTRRSPRIPIAIWMMGAFVLLAIIGPLFAPHDPSAIDLDRQYALPSIEHPLGTADNGVDILSVLLFGARRAGLVGLLVIGISTVIGGGLGTLAGYTGGKLDQAVVAVADLVQAFPSIVLHIALLALIARPGLPHLVFALSANAWVIYARLARAQTLSLREREFVIAAEALGASRWRILVRHIVPNLAGALFIQATSGLGATVLAEATLSFLGLVPGKVASWGSLLEQGSAVLLRYPHVALFSGGAIAITVLACNVAGDELRDRWDPKAKR